MTNMQKNDLIQIDITDLNNLGSGIGHIQGGESDGLTVFVQGAVTGDRVTAKVIKLTAKYAVARLEELLIASPFRENGFCDAPLSCGGCVFRHVSYLHELDRKKTYVENAFRKAGIADICLDSVLTTGQTVGYRNKVQYPIGQDFHGKTIYGFYANATHRIVRSNGCRLQPAIFDEIAEYVCRFCDTHHIASYDEKSQKGNLRHLFLRIGKATGEIMLCLVIHQECFPEESLFVEEIQKRFPSVVSIYINQNRHNTNVIMGDSYRLLTGKETIEDILCGIRFRISPQSFYQVNHDACEILYSTVADFAELTGKETLLDLYCGIGTIGLSLAKKARKTIGVEIVAEAVNCAIENAKLNAIENAYFLCGDAGDSESVLSTALSECEKVENAIVVLDPPRKGTTETMICAIARSGVSKVVYVSCNPDTLARDCRSFTDKGYVISRAKVVDMFPRTGHVETVVLLVRNRCL